MQLRNLIVVVLLTAILGGAVWYSNKQEAEGAFETEFHLFPGVTAADVTSVLIDNVERNIVVRLERDRGGVWQIVDPIEFPADPAVVEVLLDAIERNKARPVPGENVNAADLGLDPPRVVIVVTARRDGEAEKFRVEIGAVDFTKESVHVRVGDRLLRTARTIDSIVERSINDYRRPTLLGVKPDSVYEFHRTGRASFGEQRFGLEMHAFRENDGWRLESPFKAGLHPGPMALLLSNVTRLRAESFVPKHESDLAALGFGEPQLAIEMADALGGRPGIEVGAKGVGRMYFCREMAGEQVIRVTEPDVVRLTVPIELLLDRRVARAPMEWIERIEVDGPEHSVVFVRTDSGWDVGSDAEGFRAADVRKMRLFIGDLERAEFYDFLEIESLTSEETTGRIRFLGAGEEWEVRFGAPHVDASGKELVRIQRRSDEIIGLIDPEYTALVEKSTDSMRNHQLTRIDELGVTGLVVADGAREKRYLRDEKGKWTREGESAEAFEILKFVDALLNLRAERFVDPAQRAELSDSVRVTVQANTGEVTLAVARRGDEDVCEIDGEQAVLDREDLRIDLGRLLDK